MSAPAPARPVRARRHVDFVTLSPTQNTTVLVRSQHAVADYGPIAAELLAAGHLHAEQVGFVRSPRTAAAEVRLHMAGEEFCGNACMALAALAAEEAGLGDGDRRDVTIDASGARTPLTCQVEGRDVGYRCELTTPPPRAIEPYPFPGIAAGRSALVRYDGVAHLVVECSPHDRTVRSDAEAVAAHLGATEGVAVVGVMLFDPVRRELAPLVNVPALGSMVWERSCGSGTASVGAYLAAATGATVGTDVHQPGGTMRVRAGRGRDGSTRLRIGGLVRLVAEGRAYLHG